MIFARMKSAVDGSDVWVNVAQVSTVTELEGGRSQVRMGNGSFANVEGSPDEVVVALNDRMFSHHTELSMELQRRFEAEEQLRLEAEPSEAEPSEAEPSEAESSEAPE